MPYVTVASGAELFYTVPTSLTSQECPTLDPSKPSILFIHGSSADSRMWQKQFEFQRLAANFNLITLDMHFLGLSKHPKDWTPGAEPILPPAVGELPSQPPLVNMTQQADDIAEAIVKLKFPKVHLVGLGFKTVMCYQLILRHSGLFKSATFLSPATLNEDADNQLQVGGMLPITITSPQSDEMLKFAELWRAFVELEGEELLDVFAAFYSLLFGPPPMQNLAHRGKFYRQLQSYFTSAEHRTWTMGQWISAIVVREPISVEQARSGFKIPICAAAGSNHILHAHGQSELDEVLSKSPACPRYETHNLGDAPTMCAVTNAEEVNRIIVDFIAKVEGIASEGPSSSSYVHPLWTKPYDILKERLQHLQHLHEQLSEEPSRKAVTLDAIKAQNGVEDLALAKLTL